MAPNRPRNQRRRGPRPSQWSEVRQCFLGQVSPGSSATIGWSILNDLVQSTTFRIRSIKLTISPRDVATANGLQTGPALAQLRQLDPTGRQTLRSSSIIQTSTTSITHVTVDKVEYVGPWRGDALISIDCICPSKGYEIGFIYNLVVIFQVSIQPKGDACPTYCSSSPHDLSSFELT